MTSFLLQGLFLGGLPLLLAAGSAYFAWGALSRPWAYSLLSLLALYAEYIVVFYFFSPKSVGYAVSAVRPGEAPGEMPFLMLLAPYVKPMLIFPLVALPTVFLLFKLFRRAVAP